MIPGAWTPVRKGKLYCSPGCGAGCTQKQHDEALAMAQALVKKLGDGWKPVLWENMKWYAKVERGNLRVDINKAAFGSYYEAYVLDGDGFVLQSGTDKDPRQAIEIAVRGCALQLIV